MARKPLPSVQIFSLSTSPDSTKGKNAKTITLALASTISRSRSRCILSAEWEELVRNADMIPAKPMVAIAISAIVRSASLGSTDSPFKSLWLGVRRYQKFGRSTQAVHHLVPFSFLCLF